MPLIKRGSETSGDSGQDIDKQGSRRATTGGTAELFMIERRDHLDDIALARVDQGQDARMHAAQVVQPPGGEELLIWSEDRGRCGVVHPQVIAIHVAGSAASSLSYVIKDLYRRVPDTPHRYGVGLLVQLETLVVHTSIKMNGQLRNPHDRFRTY